MDKDEDMDVDVDVDVDTLPSKAHHCISVEMNLNILR